MDSADLEAAIRQAESGPKTIVLKTKTIQLTAALRITTDNIHIISEHATKIACTDENRAFEVEADGVQFKGITFENCPQSVTIETKKPTLTRFDEVNFINNIAWDDYSYGGGIYLSAAVDRGNTGVLPGAIVQSCNFTGNVAGVGGAIFAENFNLTILDSIFVGNEADAGGGAVAVEGKRAECRVERSQFLQNSVKGTGYDTEVSYIGGAPIEPFRYFRFAFPSATGGALRTRDVGELRIVQCDFDSNTATAGGAMAHEMSFDAYASSKNSVDRRIIIQKSTFTKNEAQAPPEEDASGELGGAIYTISAGNYVKWKAQDCVFEQNSARDGGAVHLVTTVATRPNMEGCTFSENTASRFGGAVLLRNTGSSKLKGCKFQKNVADKAGGGILATNNAFMLVEGLSGLPPEERRGEINTFSENTAQHGGGIACIGCGDLIVRDALFETNTAAEDGGGLYIFDSDSMMQVLQSTFIGNEAGERGGGVAVEAVASVSFTSAAESLKTVFQKNIAVSGSAMFYRAGHQKENRFSLSNAEIAEQQSIENEGIRNGGTLQLELNYLPSKAIADVLLHHVLLNKNKAIFGGHTPVFSLSGDHHTLPQAVCR